MKKLSLAILALLTCVAVWAVKVEDVENVHIKNRDRYVTDMASVLSQEAIAQADAALGNIWQQSSAEPVVVIVPDLSGEDIDTYATDLFTKWGIGKRDKSNGVLLLISIDDREMVIRTGYGAEGVLPDVLASRIIRHEIAPRFKEGDYDGGVVAAINAMAQAMTSAEARQELMSEYENNERQADEEDWMTVIIGIAIVGGTMLGILLLILACVWINVRKKPTVTAYNELQKLRIIYLALSVGFMLIPFPAYIILVILMRKVRLKKRLCPNCATRMKRVDEDNDNAYLTSSQDAEERLNSVDYDVWLCPNCGETDILPYVNQSKRYTECPHCHARACATIYKRTIEAPTTRRTGKGVEVCECHHCGQRSEKAYTIPKVVATPIVVGGTAGMRGGGGGGFSGGSFGGGFTGGGGARGGW